MFISLSTTDLYKILKICVSAVLVLPAALLRTTASSIIYDRCYIRSRTITLICSNVNLFCSGVIRMYRNIFNMYTFVYSYELDESSPIDDEEESYPYEILSKVNKRLMPIPVAIKSPQNGHCCSGHGHHHH